MSAPLSRGEKLKRARLDLGWSIEKVAQDLKLAPKQIIALEDDDHQALPTGIFVKGFVKNYARLLNRPLSDFEDERSLEEATESLKAEINPTPRVSRIEPEALPLRSSAALANRRYLMAALVIILLGGLLALIRPQHIELARAWLSALKPTAAPAPQVAAEGPIASAPSSAPVVTPEVSSPASVGPSADPPGMSKLSLSAAGESWIEVKGEGGELLFSGMLHTGDSKDLGVAHDARLVIGNAPVVTVTWQGRKIDTAPFTHDVVARLTVLEKEP